MNTAFWSAMAGVSVTFVTLVLVWLTLYLSRIRTAIREAEAAELGMKELSSRIIFVAVLSNLAFFAVPLIASLSLITGSSPNTLNLFWFSMIIYLLLFLALLLGYENGETREHVRLVLPALHQRSGKFLYYWRVKSGKWPAYLAVPTYAVFLSAIWVGWPPIAGPEDWLKGVAVFSLAFGLSCGIVDLLIFDIENTLFSVDNGLQERVEGFVRDLRAVMKDVDELYQKYETLIKSSEYQKALEQAMREPMFNTILNSAQIQELARAEQDKIRSTYSRLREEIPADCKAKVIQRLAAKGSVVTLADGKTFKEKMNILSQDAKSFRGALEGKLEFFKKREIDADGAG